MWHSVRRNDSLIHCPSGHRKDCMKPPPFDKYELYRESVQSPAEDVRFLEEVWRDARGGSGTPRIFREDFCGTFANCCEWVKLGRDRVAHGVDLDSEPLDYG